MLSAGYSPATVVDAMVKGGFDPALEGEGTTPAGEARSTGGERSQTMDEPALEAAVYVFDFKRTGHDSDLDPATCRGDSPETNATARVPGSTSCRLMVLDDRHLPC